MLTGRYGEAESLAADYAACDDEMEWNPAMQPSRPLNRQFHRCVHGEVIAAGGQKTAAAQIQDPARTRTTRWVKRAIGKRQIDRKANSCPAVPRNRPEENFLRIVLSAWRGLCVSRRHE